jgi:DNA polymerase, archaea type
MSIIIGSNNKLVKNSASIDFEWLPYKGVYSHEKTKLTAAAFCTNQGTDCIAYFTV